MLLVSWSFLYTRFANLNVRLRIVHSNSWCPFNAFPENCHFKGSEGLCCHLNSLNAWSSNRSRAIFPKLCTNYFSLTFSFLSCDDTALLLRWISDWRPFVQWITAIFCGVFGKLFKAKPDSLFAKLLHTVAYNRFKFHLRPGRCALMKANIIAFIVKRNREKNSYQPLWNNIHEENGTYNITAATITFQFQ